MDVYDPMMINARPLAVCTAALVTFPAASASADEAPDYHHTVEMGGGAHWPIVPGSFRDNYSVGGYAVIRYRWLGDRYSIGVNGLFGAMGTDKDALTALHKAQSTPQEPDITGGTMSFGGIQAAGNVFFLGRNRTGGLYATAGLGVGGSWAEAVHFGRKLDSGMVEYTSNSPTFPPPDPFRGGQARGLVTGGIGATTGTPSKAPYVSFQADVGPTLLVFGGVPVMMMGINVSFGFFI